MNPKTNELRAIDDSMLIPGGFTEVPKHLRKEAKEQLNGEESVMVPMNSKSPLAKWASRVRNNQEAGKTKIQHINNQLNK